MLSSIQCSAKRFTISRYGLKEVNGVPHLSGPGLETADTPGVTALGGKWPGR